MKRNEQFSVSLKEHFERITKERDDRYTQMFSSYSAAVTAAFEASEKAITKAEVAQTAYNARSNEFRSSLDDQAKLLLSRTEADARFQQLRELIDAANMAVQAVQLQQSSGEGSDKASFASKANFQAIFGLVVGVAGLILAALAIYASVRRT